MTTSSPARSWGASAASVVPISPALSWHTTTTASAGSGCISASDRQIRRGPPRLTVGLGARAGLGLERGDPLLQHAHPLGKNLVLVGEARDHEGEVQEQCED